MPEITTKTRKATTIAASVEAPPTVHLVNQDAANARQVLLTIEDELNGTFAEREREIRGLLTAIVCREHILILGPAGTAKSALAQAMCSAIDGGQFFGWLLTRFSTPEEVFGPVSLDGLKHDRFRRVTTGKLPEATMGFLDETFKANSAILNSLLTALNERKFDNDGARHGIPLETMVGASNELPEGPELAALYDRFMLRFWTSYTRTPEAFERLVTGDEPAINTRISLGELKIAQAAVEKVFIPKATVEELYRLRAELIAKGIVVSDRRWRKAAKVLRATAWLDGFTEVSPEQFPVLAHVLWDLPDQQSVISQAAARYASKELADVQEMFDEAMRHVQELPTDPQSPEYGQRVGGVSRELKRIMEKMRATAKVSKPSIAAKIEAIAEETDKRYQAVRAQAIKVLDL